MLPTLGFILCAYGIYALIRAWSRRPKRRMRPYDLWRRRRFKMVGGTGLAAGFIILIAITGVPAPSENFKYAGIISSGWGEDLSEAGQTMPRQEILPVKNQGDPSQPVYAYLHPETPSAQLQPENPKPRAWPKSKARLGKSAPQKKITKTVARAPKKDKDKAPVKNKAKKKKLSSPTGKLAANPG